MKKNHSLFIVNPNPVDYFTLLGVLFSAISLVLILSSSFYFAIAFMFLGMFADAFDGVLARKLNLASDFGRQLDGLADVLHYLVVPAVFLYSIGIGDVVSLVVLFLFICAGMVRLAKFNQIGNVTEGKKSYYLGMPVFWSQFLVVAIFITSWYVGSPLVNIVSNLLIAAMGVCMLLNVRFFKPKNVSAMILTIVGIIVLFAVLGFTSDRAGS